MEKTNNRLRKDRKIGILYICTGKYVIFWENFYKTAQEFLLKQYSKHYFVFTDSIVINSNENITVIQKKYEGFPMDSLLRFEIFNGIKQHLVKYDYIYFFNSNMSFVAPVSEEIFPDRFPSGLTGVIHPGHYNRNPFWFPYERNPKSAAMISYKPGRKKYFAGCLFGGKTDAFLELAEKCAGKIRDDLNNEIIAVYHDESHLNQYFSDKKILELDPGFAFPEGWDIPFSARIIILNKVLHGGTFFNKASDRTLIRRIYQKLIFILKSISWYLR